MADNILRVRRRASGGASGAPSSLYQSELAFSEVDNILYIGWGTGGAGGTAGSVLAIAGPGVNVTLTGNQTIDGTKTFSAPIVGSVTGSAATLTTGRTFTFTGDVSGTSGSFNGSANVSTTITLSNTPVTAGSYGNGTQVATFTVDSKGRLTAAGTAAIAFPVDSVNGQTGAVSLSTTNINEGTGTNLYYTDARVRANRLDQLAAPAADVSMAGFKLTNIAAPVGAGDAVNKSYVDAIAASSGSTAPFASVRALSNANITLSGTQTIDGVALAVGDRVLVIAQTAGSQNGIYVVQSGAWTRASDADASNEMLAGRQVFVNEGTAFSDSIWAITNDAAIVLGTTSIFFTQINSLGQINAGAALSKNGNTLAVVAGTGITVASNNVALTGQALALHNLATNGLIVRTAAGTVAARSIAVSGSGLSIANGDAVAANPTISLSAALSSVGGLTPAANLMVYYTGAATAATVTTSAFGRTWLNTADAAAGRTALGLGTMATQNANAVAITGGSATGMALNNSTLDGCIIDGGTY